VIDDLQGLRCTVFSWLGGLTLLGNVKGHFWDRMEKGMKCPLNLPG